MSSPSESSRPPIERRPDGGVPAEPNVDLVRLAALAERFGSSGTDMQPTGSRANYRMREHWFAKRVLAPLYRIRRRITRSFIEKLILKLEGGEWFTVTLRKIYLEHYGMRIGDYSASCFDPGNLKPGTTIGRYCSIFPSARIETANHPTNTISMNGIFYRKNVGFSPGYEIPRNKVEIGHDVWIGHNATILYPCKKIGDGAVIGAGALVTFDVPPFAVVGGYPATIIRYRFPQDKIDEIMQSQWWLRSLEELEELREEFVRPVVGRTVR